MDSVIQVLSGFGGMGLGNVGLDNDEVTLNGLAATEPAPLSLSTTVGGFSLGAVALVGLGLWFFMRPRAHPQYGGFAGAPSRRKSRRRKSRR